MRADVVLDMATENSDNPDLRDRGYVYWRLLSTDPAAAKSVVCSLAIAWYCKLGSSSMDTSYFESSSMDTSYYESSSMVTSSACITPNLFIFKNTCVHIL